MRNGGVRGSKRRVSACIPYTHLYISCSINMVSDHTIGILGFVVGIVSVGIGIYGMGLAKQGDRKLQTAEQAKERIAI
jgi:hypothetical protein